MTAKNRKLLAILGSAAVLVVAVTLIMVFTGDAANTPAPDVTDDGGTVSVGDITDNPDTENTVTTPATDEIKAPDIEDKPDTAPSTDVPDADPVLNIDSGEEVNVNISEFEEDTTPPAPPVVNDESSITDPNVEPEYDDNQTNVNSDNDTPKNGDKKDGKIYIEGFGWIVDEGGQAQGDTVGNEGDELTGNKVGNMG